jgi:hypothetical protein
MCTPGVDKDTFAYSVQVAQTQSLAPRVNCAIFTKMQKMQKNSCKVFPAVVICTCPPEQGTQTHGRPAPQRKSKYTARVNRHAMQVGGDIRLP